MLLLSRFIVQGHSMEPTLRQGQAILVSSIPFLFSEPKIDDIVLIRHSDKRSASRISSQRLQQTRRFWTGQNDEGSKFLIKRIARIDMSADGEKYFVSGDNREDSMDSRRLGWILKKDIIGKVVSS